MARDDTRQELLAKVEKLSPLIREYADQGERERHLMDPVVAALQDAGFFRMLVPRDLGGLQVDPLTFYEVIEAVARVDGSTAWCMFNSGGLAISASDPSTRSRIQCRPCRSLDARSRPGVNPVALPPSAARLLTEWPRTPRSAR